MLIRIDSSGVEDAAGDGPTAASSLDALEMLLRAHGQGKHVLSVEATARKALRDRPLSHLARASLDRIVADRASIESLRKSLRHHLVAGVGPAFDGSEERQGDRVVLKAPLHHFSGDFERAGRSVLVGEDRTDVELFECFGRAWLAKKGWRTELACELRGGGGSSIADVFEGAAADGRIVLALADSDATCPDGALGQTCHKLLKAAEGKPSFQRARSLPVRAAENLIPLSIYDEALAPHTADHTGTSAFGRLETLSKRPVPPAWKDHADLKDGLTLAHVEGMADSPGGQFWRDVATRAGRGECWRQPRCKKREECSCFVTDGLGKQVLARVVRWMKAQPPRHVGNLLDFGAAPHVDDVTDQVVAWGIAPGRRVL